MNQNKFQYKVQGVDYDVEIEEMEGNLAKVNVNGISFEVELKQPINPSHAVKRHKVEAPKTSANMSKTTTTHSVSTQQPASTAAAGAGTAIKAPLPGNVAKVKVQEGAKVNAGDVLIVLEAMKMENEILAPAAGTVKKLYVQEGKAVQQGEALIDLE